MVLFTWFVFIINPTIGSMFAIVGLYKNREKSVHYSAMLALLFASFAYWFIPNGEMDLTRYFLQLSNYSNLSWNTFLDLVLGKSTLVIQDLLFYGIAKTNNFHLLPAIVIFIVYFIVFYMITDFSNRNEISSRNMMRVIVFTLCVLPFSSLVSNIRNVLAFSIFILAGYREFEQKDKGLLTYLLYILPLFIHTSTLALLIIRFLVNTYDLSKRRRHVISIGFIISTFFIGNISNLIGILPFSNKIVYSFIRKADYYVNETGTDYAIYLQTNLFARLQKTYFISVVIFLFLIILLISKYMKKDEREINKLETNNKRMLSFYSLICLTVIGTAPIVLTVYFRFTLPVIMLSFLILLRIDMLVLNKAYKQLISIGVFVLSIGGLLQQLTLMNKMTNITYMVSSVMVRSLLNMFVP